MAGEQHGHAFVRQLAHDVQHGRHQFGIERRNDFIEQQHHGIHGQRTHERDALLLAARHAIGIFLRLMREAEALEQSHGVVLGPCPPLLQDLDRHERDVLRGRLIAEGMATRRP
ncbi:hypothetical protein RT97_05260 [Variovorax paradoxus]|uniref:Uncharacterized protein n=1 Tax=Variovorax paradoxus TaxID=34073 RepID=A0A0D0N1S5_VARPD|nr:hypothetical protein RT97_05260 [Variovorax paradoxus]